MQLLYVDDDKAMLTALATALTLAGHTVTIACDGEEALELFRARPFDIVLTDWMMPRMDGIELIRRIRTRRDKPTLVVMMTALTDARAREHALLAGADAYVTKPVGAKELLELLESLRARYRQPLGPIVTTPTTAGKRPDFVAVAIAASTGGPVALREFLEAIPPFDVGALFIALHGPAWMFEALAQSLGRSIHNRVVLGVDNCEVEPRTVYVAPGDLHMLVSPSPHRIVLERTPPENFVRPSADPLFRSVAKAFGAQALGVVLTGFGRDGTAGSAAIAAAGGTIFLQSPETCVAPNMPESVIAARVAHRAVPLGALGEAVSSACQLLAGQLAGSSSQPGARAPERTSSPFPPRNGSPLRRPAAR